MVGRTTWRYWIIVVAGLAVYGLLGWWWSSNGTTEEWLYRIGLTLASVMPVLFAIIYGVRAKWWRNEIGSSIVLTALSVIPLAAPLAYVFWFDGGHLTTSWLAWLAVSGPCLTALGLARMSYVWLKIGRKVKK